MHCQSRSLYEGLVAPFFWTNVGPVAAMYSFCSLVLAMTLMTTFACPHHDGQDHSFVQNLFHKCCMQKLLHFHCCFVGSCRSHPDQLRADYFAVAAVVACIRFGRIAPHKLLAALTSVAVAGGQYYNSLPAPCVAGIVAQRRRQQQQGLFHSTCS